LIKPLSEKSINLASFGIVVDVAKLGLVVIVQFSGVARSRCLNMRGRRVTHWKQIL